MNLFPQQSNYSLRSRGSDPHFAPDSDMSSSSSSSSKAVKAARNALDSLEVEEHKVPLKKGKVTPEPQKKALPTLFKRRTRQACISSVVKIGRNFQKPFATAKGSIQGMVKRQFDDVFRRAVKLSQGELSSYLEDIDTYGIRPNIALCKINDRVGNGLFLKPDADAMEEGTFIGIYAGEFQFAHMHDPERTGYEFSVFTDLQLRSAEVDLIEGARNFGTNQFALEVDGKKNGNFTRYFNHASAEDANVIHKYILMPDGTIQVGFWTKKRVLPGHQFLLDYREEYWRHLGIEPVSMSPSKHKLYPDGEVV